MSKKTSSRYADTRVLKSSGNVFVDLGFDAPQEVFTDAAIE